MVWNSITLMTAFDGVILFISCLALSFFFRHRQQIRDAGARNGTYAILAGICLTALFYLSDVVTMYVFPFFTGTARSMEFMTLLHLNLSWPANVLSLALIIGGFMSLTSVLLASNLQNQEKSVQLRAVFDNTPFCLNIKDRDLRYVLVNKPYNDWWGTDESVIGKTLDDVHKDPEHVAKVTAAERKVLETGEIQDVEMRVKCQSTGKYHDRWRIKFPVVGPDKSIVGVGTIAVDISRRKQAQRAVKNSEELFLKAFHSNPLPLSIADADGTFFNVNDAWLRAFGHERESVIGQRSDDLNLWRDEERREEFIRRLQETGALKGFEAQFVSKGGERVDVVISAELVTVNGKRRIFSTCLDVTEEKKSKRRLIEHRDMLEKQVDKATADLKRKAEELEVALGREKEVNQRQRQFVSMASHEFRTPLAIIDGVAQRLKRKADKNRLTVDETGERVETIRAAVKRMTRLMESTLTAARMDEQDIRVSVEACDVGKIIRDVCKNQRELPENQVISCDLIDLPETIQADSGCLEQVLTNLLSNAVKYSPESESIQVRSWTDGPMIAISVSDRGIGIDEDDLARLGERFFRAKTSVGIAGTGIGLNVTKKLLELNDGWLEVESTKGEGSTFTAKVPIAGPSVPKPSKHHVA